MKKFICVLLCVCHFLSMDNLFARDEITNVNMQGKLGWELTDASQKRIAISMSVAGVIIALAAGFIAGFVPNDVGETTPFDDPDLTNTILTD